MCGIVGCYQFKENYRISLEHIKDMLSYLHHRGPDEMGVYLEDFVGLGHARLSIIDLEFGKQPMTTNDRSFWMVYNGEIFNYIELREELLQKGYKFYTKSDTEVLLNLYIEYGSDCLNKLNGQFSFAIWNKKKKELFLARDRVGIRPLFYTNKNGAFIFGSEIKAIINHPLVEREFSSIGLDQVFTFWTTLSPNTAFKNIYELPPGHFMRVSRRGIKIGSYWKHQFPELGNHRTQSIDETIEEFNSLFTDAIKIRLRADVPVGAYLSGGIDSSITTAYIKQIFPDILKTFSIGFSEKDFDESYFQKLAVNYFMTQHSSIYCNSKDISDIFPKIVWHSETPLIRTAPAPMYLLSKLVREESYKVVITGEGADEMLAGYNIFKEMIIRRFWAKYPNSRLRPLLLQKLYPYLSHLKNINNNILKLFFGYKLMDVDSPIYSHLLRWNNTTRIKNYFDDDLKEDLKRTDSINTFLDTLPDNFNKLDVLSQAQWIESNVFMSGYLLSSQGDRMTMANSVEGRYPFLDHRVIEFCSTVQPELKLNGLREKYLLKRLGKGVIPHEIINRPKQAYRAPSAGTFLNRIPEYLLEILSIQELKRCGVFNPDSVQNLIKKYKSGKPISEVDNMALTGIISTQILFGQFISDSPKHFNKSYNKILTVIHNKTANNKSKNEN